MDDDHDGGEFQLRPVVGVEVGGYGGRAAGEQTGAIPQLTEGSGVRV